jgi:diguanylate cyclase (GGDEF)-like protein
MKKFDIMHEKHGQVIAFKRDSSASGLGETIKRQKEESDKSVYQTTGENSTSKPVYHDNLQKALNRLTAVTKSLENKIKQAESLSENNNRNVPEKKVVSSSGFGEAVKEQKQTTGKGQGNLSFETSTFQSNSQVNLQNALRNLRAAAKKLEFEIKQAESSNEKIGQILLSKKVITTRDLDEALKRKKQEPNKYLGQILCEMGLPQSKIIKGIHYSSKRKQLGQVLVELNIITAAQLDDNLLQQTQLKQRGVHMPLGTLLANNGVIGEEHYIHALSAHYSMPIVGLKNYQVNPSLQKTIGEKYALENHIVVLSNSRTKVTAAMADPHLSVIEAIEKALPRGKNIIFYLARASEIEDCLNKKYAYSRRSAPFIEAGYPVINPDSASPSLKSMATGVGITDAGRKKTAAKDDDILENLPGLRLARDRLSMSILRARRDKNLTAVLFVGLNGINSIPDTLGDEAVDYVLRELVKRLLVCVRESDTVALGGSDEFLIIANGIHTPENASQIAGNIIQLVSQPVFFDGKPAVVGTSIVIALCPFDGDDMDQLRRQSEEAMRRIKKTGNNEFCFINETVNDLWSRQ